MPGGIVIQNGIIVAVSVSVERLRISRIGHKGIGRDKPAEDRIVVPGFIEVEAGAVIQFLAGVFIRDIGGAGVGKRFPIGIVDQVFLLRATAVGEDTGGAQMIGVEITDRPTTDLFNRDALSTRIQQFGAASSLTDVEFADVGGGRLALGQANELIFADNPIRRCSISAGFPISALFHLITEGGIHETQ